jgi:hypothetical protein
MGHAGYPITVFAPSPTDDSNISGTAYGIGRSSGSANGGGRSIGNISGSGSGNFRPG